MARRSELGDFWRRLGEAPGLAAGLKQPSLYSGAERATVRGRAGASCRVRLRRPRRPRTMPAHYYYYYYYHYYYCHYYYDYDCDYAGAQEEDDDRGSLYDLAEDKDAEEARDHQRRLQGGRAML